MRVSTQEEREAAAVLVYGGGIDLESRFTHAQITAIAVDLQCELSEAVSLLQRANSLLADVRDGARPLRKNIRDFLSGVTKKGGK